MSRAATRAQASAGPGGQIDLLGIRGAGAAGHDPAVAVLDIDVDPQLMRTPGAPLMFMLRDPDGNHVVVVEEPPAA